MHERGAPLDLVTVAADMRDRFISRLQASFDAGAEAYSRPESDDPDGSDEPVISVAEILESMNKPGAESWDVRSGGDAVGGAVVSSTEGGRRRSLDLLFVDVDMHDKGVGAAIWQALESRYPDAKVWETTTPYADTRNIHFYVNKCGFRIVEFFHPGHPGPHGHASEGQGPPDLMFAFEKRRSRQSGDRGSDR